MTTLYNANVRAAYVAGEYDGIRTIDQVVAHGGFGLGALDRNDGELIILDGRAYRTAYDGTTSLLPADATTPYATVMRFRPDSTIGVGDKLDSAGLAAWLAERIDLSNRIWGIKITGTFASVTAGAGRRQHHPYRPLAQTLAEYNLPARGAIDGTLAGFHCPAQLAGINLVGPHFHFLSADHAHGGHVTGWTLEHGAVELCEADSFTVELPGDAARGSRS